MALVEAEETKKIGRGAGSGGGSLAMPNNRGNVVAKAGGRAFAAVHLLDEDVLVCDGPGEFKVRVCDGPVGVGGGN
jgi:hypothetical protein